MQAQEARQVLYELGRRADREGIGSLSPQEATALNAWSGHGVIGNGGFRYFYEGSRSLAELAAAFRVLGFAQAAEACEKVRNAVPIGDVPADAGERWVVLRSVDWNAFQEEEAAVFDVGWDQLLDAIAKLLTR
ncbi:DMP19 family protein [Corallococcus exercitus]|uniref:DNA mimic protein DMP19 C-terminal domain-containing protein n=1 Tax=Corallococcus exercitus TaxID=2316736 RepID=A0A7Y4JV61_9BACT|nr:hypothetical protein [Corallococcus exercitus]NOK11750.1 hypothetical protein [Corallococcus exercitus]